MPDKSSQIIKDCSGNISKRKVYNVIHHQSGVITGVIRTKQSERRVSFINGVWLVLGRV